jgi:FAD/FMN-containing dehydrogenase
VSELRTHSLLLAGNGFDRYGLIVPLSTIAELSDSIRNAARVEGLDLSNFRRVLEHHPEDMTITVETGMAWPDLQAALGEHEQWLPLDPPMPELWTVREVLDQAMTGPRRCGYGLVRDHVLGLKIVLASGEVIRTGGKVVKNVAGYDLPKLFIGARGTLGLIVEATFKVLPRPEAERFGQARFQSLDQAEDMLAGVMDSSLTPVVLDLHNVPNAGEGKGLWGVIGFAGAREDVDEQTAEAAALGFSKPTDLGHEARFWPAAPAGEVQTISMLPSTLTARIAGLAPEYFVARAASGILHYLGQPSPKEKVEAPILNERVKKTFDPQNKFG